MTGLSNRRTDELKKGIFLQCFMWKMVYDCWWFLSEKGAKRWIKRTPTGAVHVQYFKPDRIRTSVSMACGLRMIVLRRVCGWFTTTWLVQGPISSRSCASNGRTRERPLDRIGLISFWQLGSDVFDSYVALFNLHMILSLLRFVKPSLLYLIIMFTSWRIKFKHLLYIIRY